MNLAEQIKTKAASIYEDLVAMRRHLHKHPELSFQEKNTSAYIAEKLDALDIPFQSGVAGTGIVAILKGKITNDKVIALRADMDALPIEQTNEVSYKSVNPGVMHACGHDVHTTSLFGAATILKSLENAWGGTIKLLFQPGEEQLPGGASLMIKEGVLKNPSPTAIIAQHVFPALEAGQIGIRPGKYMASSDEIYLCVKGRGGHAALPQKCIDPILIAAHILTALQQIVSRYAHPAIPTVLTFGKINSTGGATNVIPDEVKLQGTFRTMDEDWRTTAHAKMKKVAEAIAKGMGGTCEFNIIKGYPFLINEPALANSMKNWACEYLGAENVVDLPIRMTAEDFAYFSQHLPAGFYRLGTGNKAKGITAPVHNSNFDIDENALKTGAGLMAWMATQALTYR